MTEGGYTKERQDHNGSPFPQGDDQAGSLAVEWLEKPARNGTIFRRQHAIGAYILDFYCVKAKLAIEVDGEVHTRDEQQTKDAIRDAHLADLGVPLPSFARQMPPSPRTGKESLNAFLNNKSRSIKLRLFS